MANQSMRLPKEEIIIFTSQLALIVDSDVSLYEGIKLIKEKSDLREMQIILDEVLHDISSGSSLKEALGKYENAFSAVVLGMIALGEETGNLSKALNQVAYTLEKEVEMNHKIKSAITYPIILTVMMVGVVLLLILKVMPMFNDILISLGGEMPALTKGIMAVSFFIGRWFWVFLVMIFAVALYFFVYGKTEKGKEKLDRAVLKVPIVKDIIVSLTGVQFARNLAVIVKSGISLSVGTKMIQPTISNLHIKCQLDGAIKALEEGKPADEVMASLKIFPWVLIKLFSVATTTGHMDDMLEKAAEVMERETDVKLERITTVIEPLLIVILSIIVGIILVSVILPIISIMNSIA